MVGTGTVCIYDEDLDSKFIEKHGGGIETSAEQEAISQPIGEGYEIFKPKGQS